MIDPGWDLWDAKRVRTALWPSTDDWPDAEEVWADGGTISAPRLGSMSTDHVLALYEPGRRGEASVRHAAQVAAKAGARLTVVTVAIVEPTDGQCCDRRSVYWNGVVKELAEDELIRAREAVGSDAVRDFRVISGRSVPRALADEAERCGADTVVVPRRRSVLPWARKRHARHLQRRTKRALVLLAPD